MAAAAMAATRRRVCDGVFLPGGDAVHSIGVVGRSRQTPVRRVQYVHRRAGIRGLRCRTVILILYGPLTAPSRRVTIEDHGKAPPLMAFSVGDTGCLPTSRRCAYQVHRTARHQSEERTSIWFSASIRATCVVASRPTTSIWSACGEPSNSGGPRAGLLVLRQPLHRGTDQPVAPVQGQRRAARPQRRRDRASPRSCAISGAASQDLALSAGEKRMLCPRARQILVSDRAALAEATSEDKAGNHPSTRSSPSSLRLCPKLSRVPNVGRRSSAPCSSSSVRLSVPDQIPRPEGQLVSCSGSSMPPQSA